MLPFTMDELSQAVQAGRVTKRDHPDLPLSIYNYSADTQYKRDWDKVTLACRGLILHHNGTVIARPYNKFFNLGEVNLPIQFTDPVEVMDKADGSLGILYPAITRRGGGKTHTEYAIATRGSFVSEQAIHATGVWNTKYSHVDMAGMEDYTYLFEIVFPANRIVLNYDGMDDLILLGMVQKSTGYYFGPREAAACIGWSGPVVEVFPYKSITEALGHMDRANAEGYVIRSGNFMVKLKQPDYIELHRLVTNITPKTVWEQLRGGKSVSDICSVLPDEFHDYAKSIAEPLVEKFDTRLGEILTEYEKIMSRLPADANRKAIATKFKQSQETRYLFLLLDDKSVRDVLWTELKPKETI